MDRAFLVGINTYPGAPLRGCVNDVVDMADFLAMQCGFRKQDIRLLTDRRATAEGIVQHLRWLVDGLKKGDRAFFHYSGHGAQMATRNPQQEIDGLDEVICPVDFDWSNQHVVRDKDLAKIFSAVPAGVDFIWVSDSCHSGGLTRELAADSGRNYPCPADFAWRNAAARSMRHAPLGLAKAAKSINAALISGCKSDQTSADAVFGNRYNGALTYFLLHELNKPKCRALPLGGLVKAVNTALGSHGYTQQPQLQGSPTIARRGFF